MIIPFGMKFSQLDLCLSFTICYITYIFLYLSVSYFFLYPCFFLPRSIFLFLLLELANLVEIALGVYVFFLRCLAHATFDLSLTIYSTHDYYNIYAMYI